MISLLVKVIVVLGFLAAVFLMFRDWYEQNVKGHKKKPKKPEFEWKPITTKRIK